jgi:hypothetical protein
MALSSVTLLILALDVPCGSKQQKISERTKAPAGWYDQNLEVPGLWSRSAYWIW